ncbi:vanadium-dependent haloperoxidase [Scytonema sp. NUACC26]|uniref:vanadium-dependent haloperoxidase n=1 Tax=Scytonema sp. NUACC26 TaxID=3140176 RepID=UPI0034DBE634
MASEPNSHQTSSQEIQKGAIAGSRKRSFIGRLNRRSFLGRAGLLTATATGIVTGVISSPFSFKKRGNIVLAQGTPGQYSFDYEGFSQKAYQVRLQAAKLELDFGTPPHPTNGDEERYPNKIATDTRGLPHDERGEVKLEAYNSLIKALTTKNPNDFENIILGGTRQLVNPQGPLAISLEGLNAAQIAIPPAPTLDSAEQAAEAVELYWHALLREVPFNEFQNNTNDPKVLAAVEDLNKLSAFRGPKENGVITPQTLFRGSVNYVDPNDPSGRTAKYVIPPGILDGPYISQFLLREIPFNTQFISPLIRTAVPGENFLIDYDEWLTVQNGGSSGRSLRYDPIRRYISTVRDLGEYAHIGGPTYIGSLNILSSGINAPLNPGNPYVSSKTQIGSAATFAAAHYQALLLLAPSRAIRASYWQKYYVHRRLRPEAYAGLIYNKLTYKTDYPIDSEILNSKALSQTFSTFGTYLLPHAYPEAAPFHSSYSGGASATAGVSITLLKAFFDENFVFPNPVVPDPKDPTKVIPYEGPPLTVGGELNKLATNYTIGRNLGGIHWRSDGSTGLAIGEEIAISILRDERLGYNEKFDGFTFTKFDGTKITV